jgi:alpha/beta superfamily hydrolase
LQQPVDDLRTILQWLQHDTRQMATVFDISLGATIALHAAEHESDYAKKVDRPRFPVSPGK